MDWLEQWFGMNPDGGSGMVEAEILVAVAVAVVAGVLVSSPKARAFVEAAFRKVTSAARTRRPS